MNSIWRRVLSSNKTKIFSTFLFPAAIAVLLSLNISTPRTYGQNLVLPAFGTLASGRGACSDLKIGIASNVWRVRKGDTFEMGAIRPFAENSSPKYTWAVSNGKILSGQGTNTIRVKAGGVRTPGYSNASGFVQIRLVAEKEIAGNRCSVETSTQIMVGRFRESNGFANVDDLTVDVSKVSEPCQSKLAGDEDGKTSSTRVLNVVTTATDPELDVLIFVYQVSGGKIIGAGGKVKWDLSDAPPGDYQISVGVDDGWGIRGKTMTKTITIVGCPATHYSLTRRDLNKMQL